MPSTHKCYHVQYLGLAYISIGNLKRASVVERQQTIRLVNTSNKSYEIGKEDEPILYIDSIGYKTPKIDWFMNNVQATSSTIHLKECIINGSALAVSNG